MRKHSCSPDSVVIHSWDVGIRECSIIKAVKTEQLMNIKLSLIGRQMENAGVSKQNKQTKNVICNKKNLLQP